MKRFSTGLILGLIVGLFLATATLALADNPIRIFLNGQEVQNTEAMIVNERTYVPLRMVSEALGLNVDWDGGQQAVLLTSKDSIAEPDSQKPSNPSNSGIIEPEKGGDNVIETTFEDMRAIEVDGVTYFSAVDYGLNNSKPGEPYSPVYGIDKNANMLTYSDSNGQKIHIAAINEDSIQIYFDLSYINAKYYIDP